MEHRTWIYLIKDNATGFYKIGFSQDPLKRLKNLCRQPTLLPTPNDFVLVEAWLDDTSCEAKLHEMFKEQRVRGEWFNLSETEVAQIEFYFYEAPKFSTGESEKVRVERLEFERWERNQRYIEGAYWLDNAVEGFGQPISVGFNYATMYD